eukprot:5327338-Karenia_brevis.AAC.1
MKAALADAEMKHSETVQCDNELVDIDGASMGKRRTKGVTEHTGCILVLRGRNTKKWALSFMHPKPAASSGHAPEMVEEIIDIPKRAMGQGTVGGVDGAQAF